MNWLTNIDFQRAMARLDGTITTAARLGHPDGVALDERRQGRNQLSGHANALENLALLLAMQSPALLAIIRDETDLAEDMGQGSAESRNQVIKTQIADALTALRAARGNDIIARELRSNAPITVNSACQTYLSVGLGGGQDTGGGGDTVVKRTLKLLAHQ